MSQPGGRGHWAGHPKSIALSAVPTLSCMTEQTDWTSPPGNVVVARRWKYAPPPWVLYEAVVNDLRRWMYPLTDPAEPVVHKQRRPDRIVLRPWGDPGVTAVELHIEPDGQGSAMRVLA